jgi:hypothetical protein
MKLSNEDVTRLARRAEAHVEAGVEAMEISSEAMAKLMWELLFQRQRATSAVVQGSDKTNPGTIRALGR